MRKELQTRLLRVAAVIDKLPKMASPMPKFDNDYDTMEVMTYLIEPMMAVLSAQGVDPDAAEHLQSYAEKIPDIDKVLAAGHAALSQLVPSITAADAKSVLMTLATRKTFHTLSKYLPRTAGTENVVDRSKYEKVIQSTCKQVVSLAGATGSTNKYVVRSGALLEEQIWKAIEFYDQHVRWETDQW